MIDATSASSAPDCSNTVTFLLPYSLTPTAWQAPI